ncbi:nucleotidyltransferase domain-containing protein [Myceligenerans halotolerans]
MRNIPDAMDPAVVSAIDDRLDDVEAVHDVRILWAIESGSRAWGFPSPDSDYDCRFLYVSRVEDYLSLRRRRDVIETPLDKIFDVNGWDLRKALGLMVKGNATVGEWLRSPIVYRGDAQLRDTLLHLADDIVDRFALTNHHLHVARNQLGSLAKGGSIKKFFYVLRPAMTLRWLRVHDEAVPPMALGPLLEESDVSDPVRRAAEQLVAEKARTRETGQVPVPRLLQELVDGELLIAESLLPGLESAREGRDKAWARADASFLDLLDHWST